MDDNTNEKTALPNEEANEQVIQEEVIIEEIASEAVSEEIPESIPPKEENKGNKKCILKIILWVVVILAIVGLYVLYFTQDKSPAPKQIPIKSGESTAMIVTINTDSIMAHFTLATILTEELEQESAKYDKELESKSKAFYTKYQNLVDNVQNNRITQTQAENAQRQLGQEQEQLQMLEAQYAGILQNKSISVQNEIMDSIKNASSRVNLQLYQADYVFAVSSISAIIYSNEVYDITDEVIKELNNSYEKSTK